MHEDTQRHTDDQFRLHEERQRFRAPPLNEDLPRDVTPLVPMNPWALGFQLEDQLRAEVAAERASIRNGVPEIPVTRIRLFQ